MQKNTTLDSFLNGKFYIFQYAKNYHRAGIESIILASKVPNNARGKILDIGAGTGAIGFALAANCPNAKIICVEKQIELVKLMEQSKLLPQNKLLAKNIEIQKLDIESPSALKILRNQSFSWVVANPPFQNEHSRSSPFAAKKIAHNMKDSQTIIKWIKRANQLLKDRGTLLMLMKPEHLPETIAILIKNFGNIRLLPIQAKADIIAKRIVILAQKNLKTPMTILPPLVLHKTTGGYTKTIETITRPKL